MSDRTEDQHTTDSAGTAGDLHYALWAVFRRDPHAVAEDKLGFAPAVQVSVDGAEPVRVPVWVPQDERAVPLDVLLRRCGTA